MTTDTWFIIIIGLLLFDFVFDKVLDFMNSRHWKDEIPEEMTAYYDRDKYRQARDYQQENGRLGLLSSVFSFAVMMLILWTGFFGTVDQYLSARIENEFLLVAAFFGIFMIAMDILSLPFSLYKIFRIEEKYGFNKMTVKTFLLDKVKGYLLGGLIGGGILWVVLYLIQMFPENFWIYVWAVVAGFVLFMNMFYADLILPIFNKLKPLEDGELRDEIQKYADQIGYSLKNIYVIDGSKRSTKANAFFSGLGPRKTIALYDTLIEKHTNEELVAILAHEVGHFKKKHILVSMVISMVQMGLFIFLFEQFIKIPELSMALGGAGASFHLGMIAFGFLLGPINLVLGVLMSALSRRNEFEADRFARDTYKAAPLIEGLKKLSVDNLSNLYPHPFYVFIHYSHPPLLKRVAALKEND